MAEHTKGPWEIEECEPGRFIVVYGVEKNSIPETKANARLVAAAPELLEACKNLTYQYLNKSFTFDDIEKVQKAIMKAETR